MAPRSTRASSRQGSREVTPDDYWNRGRLRSTPARDPPSRHATPTERNSPAPENANLSRRSESPKGFTSARIGTSGNRTYGEGKIKSVSKVTATTTTSGLGALLGDELDDQEIPPPRVSRVVSRSVQQTTRLERLPEVDEDDLRLPGLNEPGRSQAGPSKPSRHPVSERTLAWQEKQSAKSFAELHEKGMSDSPIKAAITDSPSPTERVPFITSIWRFFTAIQRFFLAIGNFITRPVLVLVLCLVGQDHDDRGNDDDAVSVDSDAFDERRYVPPGWPDRRQTWLDWIKGQLFWVLAIAGVIGAVIGGRNTIVAALDYMTYSKISTAGNASSNATIPTLWHWRALTDKVTNLGSHVASRMATFDASLKTLNYVVATIDARITGLETVVDSESSLPYTAAPKPVNFFSTTLGARIDPFLTSPTIDTTRGLKRFFYRSAFYNPKNPPPVQALMPWSEAGECWCAAPSTPPGLAQLAVQAPHLIRANAITIEHIPEMSTLDIRSAPKEVEVWAEAEDGHDFSFLPDAGCDSQNILDPATFSSKTWVCLGRVKYDISAKSHTQMSSLINKDVPASRFVVRVVANHGQKHSCLYRVLMHGELVDQKVFE
jgi:hypothetical protein